MTGDAFQAVLFDSMDQGYRMIHAGPPNEWRGTYAEYLAQSGKGTYPFFGDVAAAEKFTGEVFFGEVKTYGYEVENEEWGGRGLRFLRSDVERDRIMGLATRVGTMGEAIVEVPSLQIIDALKNGHVAGNTAYDGVPFFSDKTGARTFDNTLNYDVADTENPTVVELSRAMSFARAAMQRFTTDTGRPLNKVPDTIVAPPEWEVQFQSIVESTASAEDDKNNRVVNVARRFMQSLILSPYLPMVSADPSFYFLCTRSMFDKPFFWQWERLMPEKSNTRSRIYGGGRYRAEVDYHFSERAWYFQTETRGVIGYGLPHYAVKVTLT